MKQALGRSLDRVRDQRGASAVEYSLIVVAIAAVIVAIVWALGGLVKESYSDSCAGIDAEMAASASC